jgi:O-antigen/teichoic acid export membrane protein
VLFFPVLFNNVGASLLNNQRGLGRGANYRELFWINMGLTAMAALIGAASVGLTGTWLLRLYGSEFSEGLPVLWVLLVAAFLEAVSLAAYQVVQSKGRMWLSLYLIALPRDALLVVLAYFLTENGAVGLAYAYAAAWIIALSAVCVVSYIVGMELEPKTVR